MNPESLSKVRQKAHTFLQQLPATDVTSNGNTAALFTTLTGQSHDGLLTIWKAEDVAKAERRKAGKSLAGLPTTTTCNLFVIKLGAAIGSTITLGQFDIEKKLKAAGLGEAWIPATSGKRPGYGDPFKPKKQHMGVSVEFVGDMWHTAESGQGGPGEDYTQGRDIIRRKQTPWDPNTLEGWVDIDILMRISQKSPRWMIGWWRFKVGTAEEFVYLPERGLARAFPEAPKNPKLPVTAGGKAGSLTQDEDTLGVAITWPDNVTDTLRRLPGMDYMLGQRGAPQLQAFRLK
jgi:hypothetical protein